MSSLMSVSMSRGVKETVSASALRTPPIRGGYAVEERTTRQTEPAEKQRRFRFNSWLNRRKKVQRKHDSEQYSTNQRAQLALRFEVERLNKSGAKVGAVAEVKGCQLTVR